MEVMGVPGAASIGGSPLAASGWRGLPRHMQLIWPQAGAVSPVTCSLSGQRALSRVTGPALNSWPTLQAPWQALGNGPEAAKETSAVSSLWPGFDWQCGL